MLIQKIAMFIPNTKAKQLISYVGKQPRQYSKTLNTISAPVPVVIAFQTGNTLPPFRFFF
jgi:hypothetical protein